MALEAFRNIPESREMWSTRRKANSFAMLLAKLMNVWKFLSRQFESDKSMMGLRRHSGIGEPSAAQDLKPAKFYRPTLDQETTKVRHLPLQ